MEPRGRRSIFVTTELRMVNAESGVLAADSVMITIRIPFMLGLACAVTPGPSGVVTAGFLPVDATMLDVSLGYTGFAIRQFDGSYAYSSSSSAIPTSTSAPASCTGASVALPSGSRFGTLLGPVGGRRVARHARDALSHGALPVRSLDHHPWPHRTVASFADGRRRHQCLRGSGGTIRQHAGFRFFILNERLASDTLPTSLGDLRGVEVRLFGESERTVRNRPAPEQTNLVTSVFFLNRLD